MRPITPAQQLMVTANGRRFQGMHLSNMLTSEFRRLPDFQWPTDEKR